MAMINAYKVLQDNKLGCTYYKITGVSVLNALSVQFFSHARSHRFLRKEAIDFISKNWSDGKFQRIRFFSREDDGFKFASVSKDSGEYEGERSL